MHSKISKLGFKLLFIEYMAFFERKEGYLDMEAMTQKLVAKPNLTLLQLLLYCLRWCTFENIVYVPEILI
jgi:hypothetical protein